MSRNALPSSDLVREHVMLHELTTYKLGGPARWYIEPESVEQLEDVLPVEVPVLVVGRGSNLVISDQGFDGLVIRLGRDFSFRRFVDGAVIAGGATPLPSLARDAARHARAGLEWFVGIPGSVGGAVRMNAGCFGSETADVLIAAEVFDIATGQRSTLSAEQLEFDYRQSSLRDTDVVLEATFRTRPGDQAVSEEKMREITRWRRRHQPGGTLNAGSVFRNPPGQAAGAIIDRLGLKGFRIGGASVSEKHANFFVADRTATAADVYELVREVRRRVAAATGIELRPEITFAGFD